eukprot:8688512-Karenia_brevis.AAC.1
MSFRFAPESQICDACAVGLASQGSMCYTCQSDLTIAHSNVSKYVTNQIQITKVNHSPSGGSGSLWELILMVMMKTQGCQTSRWRLHRHVDPVEVMTPLVLSSC